MLLKLDNSISRKVDVATRKKPKKPLTKKQREYLRETCWQKCLTAYKRRMRSSALMADYDSMGDLNGEAFIAMESIMDKFDLSQCGAIGEFDVEGKKKPKRLEWYFLNYYYNRINFIACESRKQKKKRGTGFSQSVCDEVFYDPADANSFFSGNYENEITEQISETLKRKDKDLREYFAHAFIARELPAELKSRFGSKYDRLKDEASVLIREFKLLRKRELEKNREK